MPFKDHEWLASYIIPGETIAQSVIGTARPDRVILRTNIHDIAAAFRELRLRRWAEADGAALDDETQAMRLWACARFLSGLLSSRAARPTDDWTTLVNQAMDYAEDFIAELIARRG